MISTSVIICATSFCRSPAQRSNSALSWRASLEKLCAHMTVDQRGAIEIFEGLGFRGEALLRDQVKDPDGTKHDMVILSHDLARIQTRMEAYGMTSAF